MKVGGEWNFDETEENVGGFSIELERLRLLGDETEENVGGGREWKWNYDAYNDAADYAMWKYRI